MQPAVSLAKAGVSSAKHAFSLRQRRVFNPPSADVSSVHNRERDYIVLHAMRSISAFRYRIFVSKKTVATGIKFTM